jgi:ATP-dependent helicase/nuclease subunit A
MQRKPFSIYRSSAGSGKTYTLAKSYLEIALKRDKGFRKILGVTFTNKATAEMKKRILDILNQLAKGESHPMGDELMSNLKIDKATLQVRAKQTLVDILHNYSRFSIVTIDSFFHQVIRSFTREIGLQGTFSIEMDNEKVLQMVIDQMLLEVGSDDHKQLMTWLTQFAEDKVEEGKSWDFRKDIATLSYEILKDEFKVFAHKINQLSADPQFFTQVKKDLDKAQKAFENGIKKLCDEVFEYFEKKGISVADIKGKGGGPAGLFTKLQKLDLEITDGRRAAADNIEAWLVKKELDNALMVDAVENFILPKYNELISFFDEGIKTYLSVIEVKNYYYTFGILSYINKFLQQYRDENDVMLISDLPDFLSQIIHDSETPFIYEKVGSAFDHYLIDEFQDTSSFQWNNFKPLVKNATDQGQFCMVVGDVKQSIYRFRGGDWELLQNKVKADIGTSETVHEDNLDKNYRSTPEIINFNNFFFTDVQDVIKAQYFDAAVKGADSEEIEKFRTHLEHVLTTYTDVVQKIPDNKKHEGYVKMTFIDMEEMDDEESWKDEAIRQTIVQVEELQRQGYELRDVAILTRNAKEGKSIAKAFLEYGNSEAADSDLRYDVVSSEALYLTSSHIVRFIISLIKWLNDENDLIELAKWQYELIHYLKGSEQTESTIFCGIGEWKTNTSNAFVEEKDRLKKLPLYELVESVSRLFQLNEVKEEFAYLQGFQDAVLDYSKNERGDIISFLEWWERTGNRRAIKIADENNAVKILTIHKSKGLEFPIVILPFLNWASDHKTNFDNILWCEGVKEPPFDQLPVVPLKYSSKLVKTHWAQQYFQEKLKALIDSLNLLYVAFTRPEKMMFGFAPKPEFNKGKTAAELDLKNISEMIYAQLSTSEHWDETGQFYSQGAMYKNESEPLKTAEFSLSSYHTGSWREKIHLQIRGSAELNESQFVEATARGIKLHDLLSQIKYETDLSQFEKFAEYEDLKQIISNEAVSDWFEDKWTVSCEVPILLPSGDFKRIDRLNLSDTETIIIDYKTGAKKNQDINQVKGYIKLIEQMGYKNVSGRLIYLEEIEVVTIDN